MPRRRTRWVSSVAPSASSVSRNSPSNAARVHWRGCNVSPCATRRTSTLSPIRATSRIAVSARWRCCSTALGNGGGTPGNAVRRGGAGDARRAPRPQATLLMGGRLLSVWSAKPEVSLPPFVAPPPPPRHPTPRPFPGIRKFCLHPGNTELLTARWQIGTIVSLPN